MRRFALQIVERVLRKPESAWPDEFEISGDTAKIAGAAWKTLSAIRIVAQTGRYRRSESPGRNSSLIFEYRLYSPDRGRAFLLLNKPPGPPKPSLLLPQPIGKQIEIFDEPTTYPN